MTVWERECWIRKYVACGASLWLSGAGSCGLTLDFAFGHVDGWSAFAKLATVYVVMVIVEESNMWLRTVEDLHRVEICKKRCQMGSRFTSPCHSFESSLSYGFISSISLRFNNPMFPQR